MKNGMGVYKTKQKRKRKTFKKKKKKKTCLFLFKYWSVITRFCVEGLPKILDFGYFVLIWWQTDKKHEILKQGCKDLFIWTELPIVWLIIWSDNIFNIEVNGVLVHKSLIGTG